MYTPDIGVISKEDRLPPVGGRGFVNYPYFDYEKPFVRTQINNVGPQIDHMPSAEFGLTYTDLLTKPDLMKKFLISVIEMNYSVGHLSVPPLVRAMWWDQMEGTFVLAPLFEVHSNVGEGEVIPLRTVKFDKLKVSMTKSVLKIGITDEMKMASRAAFITPQDYMRSRMGEAFAYELDAQILTQLQNKPMKTYVDMEEGEKSVQKLVEKVIPGIIGAFMQTHLRVTGLAVNPMTWAYFQGVLNRTYHGMAMFREGVFPLMQGVDVCPCSLVPYNKMYFVSNEAPGIMVLNMQEVVGRGFDDIDTASEVQRVDVYRQCFSNIITRQVKTKKNGQEETYTANAGVYELTLNGVPDPDLLYVDDEPDK